MPISSSVRMTRTAISPRFATSTFENMRPGILLSSRLQTPLQARAALASGGLRRRDLLLAALAQAPAAAGCRRPPDLVADQLHRRRHHDRAHDERVEQDA